MGAVLLDLEHSLRSRKDVTPQEAHVLETCKSRAVRAFTGSGIIAGSIAVAVTGRLSRFYRVNIAAGVGTIIGLWRFVRSIDSCVENILAQDGTRLQMELANIIVQKYHNDPQRMQFIAKHFYTEHLFKDSAADQLILTWRYRNFYSDGSFGQGSHVHNHESMSPGEPQNESYKGALGQSHDVGHFDSNIRMTNFGTKQMQLLVSPQLDLMTDPLDCVFGDSAPIEDINSSNASKAQPRMHSRAHKRSHRRNRIHRQESPLISPTPLNATPFSSNVHQV